MLKINNLQFELNDEHLFKPIHLSIPTGTCLQLCGPNGVGKTTVLKILAGLTKARRGSILFHDKKIPSLSAHGKYLGHELALKAQLTVLENLQYYAILLHANPAEIEVACNFFDLYSLQHQRIENLSAGQKCRCQLAKLLIGKAQVWLLDEPFSTLDQKHIQQLILLLKIFIKENGIIIFTSHHPVHIPEIHVQQFFLTPSHEH